MSKVRRGCPETGGQGQQGQVQAHAVRRGPQGLGVGSQSSLPVRVVLGVRGEGANVAGLLDSRGSRGVPPLPPPFLHNGSGASLASVLCPGPLK